jgi:hypothetical protein
VLPWTWGKFMIYGKPSLHKVRKYWASCILQYSWQHIVDPSSPWLVWGSNGNSMTLHLCLVLKTNEVSEKTLNFLYSLGWWTVDAWIYAIQGRARCYIACVEEMEDEVVFQMQPHTLSFHKKLVFVCYKIWNAKDETPKFFSMFKPPKHTKKFPIHSESGYTNRSQLQKNNILLWIHDILNAKYGLYQVV